MKRGSTTFLKIAVFLIGLPVLAICIFGLPLLAKEAIASNSALTYILFSILLVMYAAAIPFFMALYQSFQLLNYIDQNKAFSKMSVQALKVIKSCAFTISGFYVIGMPFFYIFAELDDAPGVILIGMAFIFASMVIAIFAAVLERLLREVIHMKSENDLTV